MKPIYYKLIYLLLLIPAISLANGDIRKKGKYTKEKSMKKEFSVSSNALLKISNDYGNLDITSWDQDKIVMEINIKVNGNDEEKVIEKLESIGVDFEASSQMVSARTTFNKDSKSWWSKFSDSWGGNNLKLEINYTVKVPITNSVDLNNDYGSITLDKTKGNAKISCDYGQIIVGELLGNENYISIDYTHNSTIKYMKSGKINADYSDFILDMGDEVLLNADYTKSKIKAVKELNYNCDYGSLKVEKAGIFKGNGDYLDTNIGNISNSVNINSDYGSIDIKNLESTTNNVNIRTDYTGVSIGYDSTLSFDFVIKTSYGGINLDDSISTMKKSKDNSSKDYRGYHGEKNSGNSIDISTSYGGVKLRKN
ncbi:hypothetical protein J8L88_04115 [Aquimarina sp. MMG015]|uniref:hypothetical protein n=1 Tax=unclassified Aquimarina TaxID=2627091 RepID=UPI000E5156C1|nr:MULTISPECIES: hypothetical protein [unclassified Aquimarina]AXT58616.1 hypothetical protein D1815_04605 [Aquimarina sp. AD1]MBQ4802028.1 hypothetical protein [Aquimarina sp. MMG015]RKN25539.1 hypothetical protein D7035_10050 [Aquimarina sp. AD1]